MKIPALRWFLPLFGTLSVGVGILVDRYALPRPASASSGAGNSEPGQAETVAGSPDSAMEQALPFLSGSIKPFGGTVADLLGEARNGDWNRAQLRITLLLAGTPAEGIARLIHSVTWPPNMDSKENQVFTALVQRWAESDPAAALAWGDMQETNLRQRVQNSALEIWARASPEKALAYARRIGPRGERSNALSLIAAAVARDDPRAALRILQAETKGSDSSGFHGMFQTWATEDPAAAHRAALGLSDKNQRQTAMNAVMGAWAESDPEAATDAALALTDTALRNQTLQNVLAIWSTSDPTAALTVAQSLTDVRTRRDAVNNILSNWAERDPLAASAVFAKLSSRDREQVAWQLAGHWADKDPRAALAWAQSLDGGNDSQNAFSAVFQKWASNDGPAAVAALDGLPSRLRSGQLENVASQWASYDRDAALRWAQSLSRPKDQARALGACLNGSDLRDSGQIDTILADIPAGSARSTLISNIAESNAWGDPEGTLAWLRKLPAADFDKAMQGGNIIQSLAESAPKEAADLLGKLSAGSVNSWIWSNTASNFAREDPAAALEWARSIETPGNRNAALESVLSAWAEDDPHGAIEQARTLTDPAARSSAMNGILARWAGQNPESLLEWAQNAQGDDRENALIQGSIQLAGDNPAISGEVVALLLQSANPSKLAGALGDAVSQIAGSWFSEDIGKACDWAASLPAGAAQERAIAAIASEWTGTDAVAASEWIQRLPQGSARDGAVASLVNGIAQADPESAFIWASSIGDMSSRDGSIRTAVAHWQNFDPAAARTAVEGASLPEDLRRELLRNFEAGAN